MAWDFKKELSRKAIHLFSILILFIYYLISQTYSKQTALLILVFLLIIALELEYLRIDLRRKIPVLEKIWTLRRQKEKNQIGGDVFFIIGAIIVLSVLDLRIATAAILMTTFGDLASALVGKSFGKRKFFSMERRAWEGVLAEFFVDIFMGMLVFFVLADYSIASWPIWVLILAMSFIATLVETMVYKLDDNLLVPVFAGFIGEVMLIILKAFNML